MSAITESKDATLIKFKYLKEVGFTLGDKDGALKFGNFTPTMCAVPTQVNGIAGTVWVDGYDFNEEHEVRLPPEIVPELPEYIALHNDASIAEQYKLRRAEEAAKQHALNNEIRAQLNYYEQKGYIKVTYDSFMEYSKKLRQEANASVKSEVKKAEK